MLKIKIVFLIIVTICFLSSCIKEGVRTDMLGYNEEKDINVKIEKIIEAINDKDKDAIKTFFSKSTLDELDDFDESIENLFAFIQGSIDSWEKRTGSSTFDSKDYDNRKREYSAFYDVNTAEQQYFFLLDICSIDTENPDNVGIYLLLVVRAEDRLNVYDGNNKILFDGKEKLPRIGIYLPF